MLDFRKVLKHFITTKRDSNNKKLLKTHFEMTKIYIETIIHAPIERVFDLARSIDLHQTSTKGTNEKAIGGRLSGLIEQGETVTWRAKHLGVYQQLSVVITRMEKPHLFEDRMIKGAFAAMKHIHRFEATDDGTKMIDEFEFKSPFGIIGRWVNQLFLKDYMTKFLLTRNEEIKTVAENNTWKAFLHQNK
jgi:ligand-binding SRPBCC domain-containing protein